jgi:hypothetical protein
MIDRIDEEPTGRELNLWADIAEELTRRIEAGDAVSVESCVDEFAVDPARVKQFLPTLTTMVRLGEQLAREQGSRNRLKPKINRNSPPSLNPNPDVEDFGP